MICKIIPEKCIACGLCQVYSPTIFDYDDQGIVIFKNTAKQQLRNIPVQQEKEVVTASQKCPVHAIMIEK